MKAPPAKTVKTAKTAAAAKPVVHKEPKGNVKESTVKVKPVAAAVAAPVPRAAPAPMPAVSPVVPPKAGRPSSRLASLTVPSMAQSVASTAAKASYTQTMSSPLIVPPLPSAVKKDPKLANNWKTKPATQLTDAELMAMPDSEYMNDVQMAAFRQKLVVLKQDILSSAGETTEHLREDTVVVPDPADRATIEEEHALELRTRDRERKLLKKIEQSIARIDAGDYGYCDETGEPIGVGRLLARPTATLSLEAQQRRELKQKMFGD
ncbi:MAG TPA: RNA polymerase-binding protein DksA [Burkholderiaceae bacterium]|nr:RNA polymerase-binding protein DksA [Burkholderiaceae bacterium]